MIYVYTCTNTYTYAYTSIQMFSCGSGSFARVFRRNPSFRCCGPKTRQKGSKRCKKAQKGSKRRSKRLFEPARCRQCARRGCSSLLRRRQCARRGCSSLLRRRQCVRKGCSSLLFKITIRKCCTRLTLCSAPLCSALLAPCMYMHGSTLVYIYKHMPINIIYLERETINQKDWNGIYTEV